SNAMAWPRAAKAWAVLFPRTSVAPVITMTLACEVLEEGAEGTGEAVELFIQFVDLRFANAFHNRTVILLQEMLLAAKIDHVTGFGCFRFQIKTVVLIGRHNMWNAPVDLNAVLRELRDLLRVVCHQLNRFDLERH